MNFPLRVIFAILVLTACYAIAIWCITSLLRAKRLTESQRWTGIGAALLLLSLLIGWVIFVWPTYRD